MRECKRWKRLASAALASAVILASMLAFAVSPAMAHGRDGGGSDGGGQGRDGGGHGPIVVQIGKVNKTRP